MENSKKGKGNSDVGGVANQENEADRDKVKSEREARRLAKQAAKQKLQDKSRNLPQNPSPESKSKEDQEKRTSTKTPEPEKSNKRPSTKGERKKDRKSSEGDGKKKQSNDQEVTEKLAKLKIKDTSQSPAAETSSAMPADKADPEKKSTKQLSKAERRALQEAQRAAKANKTSGTNGVTAPTKQANVKKEPTATTSKPKSPAGESSSKSKVFRKPSIKTTNLHRVKLFNHLYNHTDKSVLNDTINSNNLHPAIIRLGVQYASGIVKGCNARCLAFMNAIKAVIQEYETPPQKVFSRGIEEAIQPCLAYLHNCRPLAVSVTNAMKYIKWQTNQLPPGESDSECKALLLESIDTYIRDQIEKAVEAISITVQEKISDGDVILTFGCSSVIQNILDEAKSSKRDFRVIVVDARPCHEGQEMLRRLVAKDIKCTCVLINAVGFIMPEVCICEKYILKWFGFNSCSF